MNDNNTKYNPWMDIASYGLEDAQKFKGREEDVDRFSEMIDSKTMSVLYANSGIGKTSFINAGVVPLYIAENYYPIHITFTNNLFDDDSQIDIEDWIIKRMIASFENQEKDSQKNYWATILKTPKWENISNLSEDKSPKSLWWFLHSRKMIDKETTICYKPLLIFDQFEEVFSKTGIQSGDNLKERLFKAIEELSSNAVPVRVIKDLEELDSQGIDPDFNHKINLKVIFSLRKEYLSDFDYWTNNKFSISELYRNRMYLLPLTREQAERVITEQPNPENEGECIDTLNEIKDAILDKINGKKDEVEPLMLSVLCSRLYDEAMSKGLKHLTKQDVDSINMDTLISKFYINTVSSVITNPKQVYEFEEQMVDKYAHRNRVKSTLVLDGEFDRKYKKNPDDKETTSLKGELDVKHIIRVEKYGDDEYVELIHDRIAEVIHERIIERKNQKKIEERRKANYQKFISRQNPLTLGGRRIWDNKTFSFSEDNSRGNSLYNSSNRMDSLDDIIQRRKNDNGEIEQLFFDKLFKQTSNTGKITFDFENSYSRDGISVFKIETIQIIKQINTNENTFIDSKKKLFSSDGRSSDSNIETIPLYRQIKIKEITFLDSDKKKFYTSDGFCGIKYKYDKGTGNEIRRDYICDRYTSVNIATIKFERHNKYGFPEKAMYFDVNDKPCRHIDGNYGVEMEYDDFGNEICRWFLDQDGNVAPIYNGVCGLVSKYDYDQDRVIEQYFINKNKEEILDDYGYHGVQYNYNEASLVSETIFIDKKGKQCNNPEGYCVEKLQYDDKGRIVMQLYYDENEVEVTRKDGDNRYSRLKLCYDELDRIESMEMYSLSSRSTKIVRYNYNLKGTLSESRYYERSNTQEGQIERKSKSVDNHTHQIKYDYDEIHGVLSGYRYFDESGKPVNDDNNCAEIRIGYDSLGNIFGLNFYNVTNLRTPFYKITYEHKDNGFCAMTSELYEIKKRKTIGKLLDVFSSKKDESNIGNVAILLNKKISNGVINHNNELKKEFFDENNEYIPGTPLTVRRKYDIYGNVVEELLYDKDDKKLIFNNEGVCGWRNEYDIETGEKRKKVCFGNTAEIIEEYSNEEYDGISYKSTRYFNEENEPILCSNGYHKILETESPYNDDLYKQVMFFDRENKPCKCKNGYHKQLFIDDKDNNKRIVLFLDKDQQRLVNNRARGFAKKTFKRYDSFKTYFYYPFMDHDVIRFYDEDDKKVDVEYNGKTGYKFIEPSSSNSLIKVEDSNGKTKYINYKILWRSVNVILVPLAIVSIVPFYVLYELVNKIIDLAHRKKENEEAEKTEENYRKKIAVLEKKGLDVSSYDLADAYDDLGVFLFQQDRNEEAIEALEHALMIVGNSKDEIQLTTVIHNHIAQVFRDNKEYEKAEYHFKECVRYTEKKEGVSGDVMADLLMKVGVMLARQEKYDECMEVTERALSLASEENVGLLRSIHSNLAYLYKEKGELDKAEEHYRKLIAIMEGQGEEVSRHDLADAYDDLGVCLYQLDRNSDAVETLERALGTVGNENNQLTAAIHNHIAQVFRDNKEYENAEYHFKECVRYTEKKEGVSGDVIADLLMKVGVMLARQEKYDECMEVTERALSLASEENVGLLRSIHSNLAYLYKEKGELDKAEEHYRKLIAIMEGQGEEVSRHDLADAYDDLGVCLYQLDRNSDAVESLEQALKIIGNDNAESQLIAAIHDHLAQTFRANDEYDKAELHYKECTKRLEGITSVPSEIIIDHLMDIGMMMARQEKYEECIEVTERALSMTSDEKVGLLLAIHTNLAYLYKKTDDYEKAERHYRERITLMEKQGEGVSLHDLADAYDDLGLCLFMLHKYDESKEKLEYALKFAEENDDETKMTAVIRDHLAMVNHSNNDKEQA